jgi:hypothetical protein
VPNLAQWSIETIRTVYTTAIEKNTGTNTMTDANQARSDASRMSKIAPYTRTALLSLILSVLAAAQPVLAQANGSGGGGGGNVCQTQMGGFVSAVTSSFGTLAIAGILIAIFIGVAARPFIRSGGQASALNDIMSKAFVGLIILILAIPIITWGLSFTPFAPSLSCIPFLGG